jgi:hypothetical protein
MSQWLFLYEWKIVILENIENTVSKIKFPTLEWKGYRVGASKASR